MLVNIHDKSFLFIILIWHVGLKHMICWLLYDMSFVTKFTVYDKKLMSFETSRDLDQDLDPNRDEIGWLFCPNLLFGIGRGLANSICPIPLLTLVKILQQPHHNIVVSCIKNRLISQKLQYLLYHSQNFIIKVVLLVFVLWSWKLNGLLIFFFFQLEVKNT